MKKLVILLAVILSANVMMAQKTDRTNAYMYNKNGQYDKAAESIEKCVHHDGFLGMKPKDQAQAWLYRGMIYLNIHQNPEFAAKYPDCLEKAYEALENCVKADANYAKDNAQDIYPRIAAIAVNFFQDGVENFNNQAYPQAATSFRKSYEISLSGANPDTSALVNTALAYQKGGMFNEALANYEELKNLGYKQVDLYKNMAICYNGLGNEEKSFEMIQAGLEKNPGDISMIIEKVNIYLKNGRSEEAVADLNKLHELEPNNASYLFVLGTIYGEEGHGKIIGSSENEVRDAFGEPKAVDKTATEQGNTYWWTYEDGKEIHFNNEGKVDMARNCPDYLMGSKIYDPDKAIGYYKEALNVNPTFYDADYNLAALYINLSNKKKAEANEITGFSKKEIERYNALVAEAEEIMRTGLPYAEEAYRAQPSDDLKHVLKTMYVQLKMMDEAKALDAE